MLVIGSLVRPASLRVLGGHVWKEDRVTRSLFSNGDVIL
jgi:hypothetical protein